MSPSPAPMELVAPTMQSASVSASVAPPQHESPPSPPQSQAGPSSQPPPSEAPAPTPTPPLTAAPAFKSPPAPTPPADRNSPIHHLLSPQTNPSPNALISSSSSASASPAQLATLLTNALRESDALRRELQSAQRRAAKSERLLAALNAASTSSSTVVVGSPGGVAQAGVAVTGSASGNAPAGTQAISPTPNGAHANVPEATVKILMEYEARLERAERAREESDARVQTLLMHWGDLQRYLNVVELRAADARSVFSRVAENIATASAASAANLSPEVLMATATASGVSPGTLGQHFALAPGPMPLSGSGGSSQHQLQMQQQQHFHAQGHTFGNSSSRRGTHQGGGMHAPNQSGSSNVNVPGQHVHTHNHFGASAPYRSTQAIQEISLPPPPSASAHGQSQVAGMNASLKRGRRRSRGGVNVATGAGGEGTGDDWEVHKRMRVGGEYEGRASSISPGGSPRMGPYAGGGGQHVRRGGSPSTSSRVAGTNISMHHNHNTIVTQEEQQQRAIDIAYQRRLERAAERERERFNAGNGGSKHGVREGGAMGTVPGDAAFVGGQPGAGVMRTDSPLYHVQQGQFFAGQVQGHGSGRHHHHHHQHSNHVSPRGVGLVGGMQPGQAAGYPVGSGASLTAQQQQQHAHMHHMQQERERYEYDIERERGRRRERDGGVRGVVYNGVGGGGGKRGRRGRSYSAGSSRSSLSLDEMLLEATTDKRRDGSVHSHGHHRHRERDMHGHHHHSYASSVVGGGSVSGRRSRSGTMGGAAGTEVVLLAQPEVGPHKEPPSLQTYQTHVFAPPVTGAPVKKNKSVPASQLVTLGPGGVVVSGGGAATALPTSALPGGGYPGTNAAGQRICRQCGMPGRYKEGKCVEKWGPGPEGPGTVCDRCRKKMKRVERRGTMDAAQAALTSSSASILAQSHGQRQGASPPNARIQQMGRGGSSLMQQHGQNLQRQDTLVMNDNGTEDGRDERHMRSPAMSIVFGRDGSMSRPPSRDSRGGMPSISSHAHQHQQRIQAAMAQQQQQQSHHQHQHQPREPYQHRRPPTPPYISSISTREQQQYGSGATSNDDADADGDGDVDADADADGDADADADGDGDYDVDNDIASTLASGAGGPPASNATAATVPIGLSPRGQKHGQPDIYAPQSQAQLHPHSHLQQQQQSMISTPQRPHSNSTDSIASSRNSDSMMMMNHRMAGGGGVNGVGTVPGLSNGYSKTNGNGLGNGNGHGHTYGATSPLVVLNGKKTTNRHAVGNGMDMDVDADAEPEDADVIDDVGMNAGLATMVKQEAM